MSVREVLEKRLSSATQARHEAEQEVSRRRDREREAEAALENFKRQEAAGVPVDRTQRVLTDGSPVSADHADLQSNGQQKGYVVLSNAERAKGFVRPVRRTYIHVGKRPKYPTRALTDEEQARYGQYNYVAYEPYPEGDSKAGRFWTEADLNSGCGSETTMAQSIAETYAREPSFYGGTFCVRCATHFPVGEGGEFVWAGTQERVGT
jgi:hypothetical protein